MNISEIEPMGTIRFVHWKLVTAGKLNEIIMPLTDDLEALVTADNKDKVWNIIGKLMLVPNEVCLLLAKEGSLQA